MELKEIQNLIKFVAKSGASEVKLEMGDIKITIKTSSGTTSPETAIVQQIPVPAPQIPVPTPQIPVSTPVAANIPTTETTEQKTDESSRYITIKSPMIGTLYRKPSPDKENFVNLGDRIESGSVVCIIEAMKLFNEIESEVSGTIVKILVDDATPVEFDQDLFLVDPS